MSTQLTHCALSTQPCRTLVPTSLEDILRRSGIETGAAENRSHSGLMQLSVVLFPRRNRSAGSTDVSLLVPIGTFETHVPLIECRHRIETQFPMASLAIEELRVADSDTDSESRR